MSENERQMVKVSTAHFDLFDLDFNLRAWADKFNSLAAKYGADTEIDIDGTEIWVYVRRPETDLEYETRLKNEERNRERRRRQYEELKQEFENDRS